MSPGGGRLALAFVLGGLSAAWLPVLPDVWGIVLLAALTGIAAAYRKTRTVAFLLLGGLWFMAAAQWQVADQWPRERAGEELDVVGTVVGLPETFDETVRFIFDTSVEGNAADVPDRLRVRWYRPSRRIEPGERWRLTLALQPPLGRHNPGGFDYGRYLLAERIGGLARVRGDAERLAPGGLTGWLDRQRQRISAILLAETVDRDVAALKRALGVADRSGIDDSLSERLRQTDTAHLLAISGLHVGLVATVTGLLAGWLLSPLSLLFSRLDRRRIGVAAGLVAALIYAGLAGFTLPTQRALIMLGVVGLGLVGRRSLSPGRALLLALVAVVVFDPLAALATGFWMSFAAVTVLIWAFAWRPGRSGPWLGGLLRAQCVLMIGLLPLNVGFFGQLVPVALLANLIAVPLVGLFVLPLLLVELLGILVGLPPTPLAALTDPALSILLGLLAWLHATPFAFVSWAAGPPWTVALAGLGGLWLIAPTGWPARWLGLALCIPLLWPDRERLDADSLELWFLDVGDGLAAVIRTADETALYDTGPGDGAGGDALSAILPGIRGRLGVDGFDRVIVSHAHRGHAGGVGSVREEGARLYGAAGPVAKPCRTGLGWRSSGYRFRFLHPSPGLPDLGGNSSCVLHVAGPGGSVLLTGGIDRDVEARLVRQFEGPRADVLQLASGGHRDASTSAFLEAVSPSLAVASVARYDRWGRVHEATRSRLAELEIDWLATGRCGAVRVLLRPGEAAEVSTAYAGRRRFWSPPNDCP